jgi:hypothetical protein
MKLELLTNTIVVDDAIRFVASNTVKTTEKTNPIKQLGRSQPRETRVNCNNKYYLLAVRHKKQLRSIISCVPSVTV